MTETEQRSRAMREEKAKLMNDELSQQSAFFSLRERHFAALLLKRPWWWPNSWSWKRAHANALLDAKARTDDATALYVVLNEKMRPPAMHKVYFPDPVVARPMLVDVSKEADNSNE